MHVMIHEMDHEKINNPLTQLEKEDNYEIIKKNCFMIKFR